MFTYDYTTVAFEQRERLQRAELRRLASGSPSPPHQRRSAWWNRWPEPWPGWPDRSAVRAWPRFGG
jgi:hypothetical protein